MSSVVSILPIGEQTSALSSPARSLSSAFSSCASLTTYRILSSWITRSAKGHKLRPITMEEIQRRVPSITACFSIGSLRPASLDADDSWHCPGSRMALSFCGCSTPRRYLQPMVIFSLRCQPDGNNASMVVFATNQFEVLQESATLGVIGLLT